MLTCDDVAGLSDPARASRQRAITIAAAPLLIDLDPFAVHRLLLEALAREWGAPP